MAALHNQTATVEWLKMQLYPPAIKCQRILHQNASVSTVCNDISPVTMCVGLDIGGRVL